MKPSRPMSSLHPALALAGAVVLWGTSFVAAKEAYASFAPMAVVWLRMVFGALAFMPFIGRIPAPRRQPGDRRALLLALICIPGLYYLCEGYALQYTTSGQAGVISATLPLMIALGARIWLGEPLTRRSLVALGVSLAGVAALSIGGPVHAAAPNPLLGNALEILAMLAAAGSMLTIKRLSARYDPWLLTGLQTLAGVILFLPLAAFSDPSSWLVAPLTTWLSLAYLGIAVGLGAFGLYNAALAAWPASRAAQAINLVPAVALTAGWVWRGESLSPLQIGASLVVVGAVVVASTAPERVVQTESSS